MPAKKKIEEVKPDNPLLAAINAIRSDNPSLSGQKANKEVVDIITFCNSPQFLGFKAFEEASENDLTLYPSQKVILKSFYMGTLGNEDIKLDKSDWEWLYQFEKEEEKDGILYENNIKDVIRKIHNKNRDPQAPNFRELHLVLGRRGSKTFIASIISAYEAYKLLTINDGDPHSYYRLPPDDEIAIINVALSLGQAGRLFGQLQSRIRNSPFFNGKIAKETTSEIRLYTKKDLEKKQKGSNLSIPGSILLLCGHSNPDSLAGYNAILILFDELAFYDETGKVTGQYFYNRLKPSLAHFSQFKEGRLVEISSPNTRMGIFYKIYEDAKNEDSILSFQLPTWCTNPGITYDHPDLVRDRKANLDMFATEYGAQWSAGSAFGNYFEEGMIERCIKGDLSPHLSPMPYTNYYLHVDPAQGGNNYAAVLVAKKRYINTRGEKRTRCILAGTWVWRPVPGLGLLFNEIDKEILRICKIYRPLVVSYDDYQSTHSVQLLRSHGVHTQVIPFNRGVKAKIYQNLRNMMGYMPEPELWLYDDGGESSLLLSELKNLKWKHNQRGLSIITDKTADVKSDDLSDCLAGAVSMATEGFRADLPAPVLVRTGWR